MAAITTDNDAKENTQGRHYIRKSASPDTQVFDRPIVHPAKNRKMTGQLRKLG